jgi:hypothetical protein
VRLIKLPDGAWIKSDEVTLIYWDGETIEIETLNSENNYSIELDDCEGFNSNGKKDVQAIINYIATEINKDLAVTKGGSRWPNE